MRKDRLVIYRELYNKKKVDYINSGETEDKASRLANLYAVNNTNKVFIKGEK